jgi:hypothetical protein
MFDLNRCTHSNPFSVGLEDIEALTAHPSFPLAGCLAHLGRLDEARREIQAGLAKNPKFTTKRFRTAAESDNAVFLAQLARVIQGMRIAGAPEE